MCHNSSLLETMMDEFRVRFRMSPAGDDGPLVPEFKADIGILQLRVPIPREYPRGLNIDDLMIFEMLLAGGLDAGELLTRAEPLRC